MQLIEKCQEMERLALHISYNAEYKPQLESVTNHFVDALMLRLAEDIEEMKHIINLQFKPT